MNYLRSTQASGSYGFLGTAFKTRDLWLARHQTSQQLVLVQRFDRLSPSLHSMLAMKHECLPQVIDHWLDDGSIYLVLERVEGPGIDQLGSGRLCASTTTRLKSLLAALSHLGHRFDSTCHFCLDCNGSLRLRCFPCCVSAPTVQAA